MEIKTWIGYYVGNEFPQCYGEEIEIRDDKSDVNAPCYEIKFSSENTWHGNMDDQDWQIMNPSITPPTELKN